MGAGTPGWPAADPRELDTDGLITAQVLGMGIAAPELIIATTNVGHLSQFLPADLWTNIGP